MKTVSRAEYVIPESIDLDEAKVGIDWMLHCGSLHWRVGEDWFQRYLEAEWEEDEDEAEITDCIVEEEEDDDDAEYEEHREEYKEIIANALLGIDTEARKKFEESKADITRDALLAVDADPSNTNNIDYYMALKEEIEADIARGK